jgi:hypothetical protein
MNNRSGNKRATSRWLRAAILPGLITVGLVAAGLWSISWIAGPTSNLPSRDASVVGVTSSPTPPAQAPPPVATSTWSGQALDATAVAIAATLPTLSPNPRSEPTKDAYWRTSKVWDVAIQTAIAIYPPPTPITFPDVFTPTPHPPWPTEIVHKRPTSQGMIYDERFIGPPCNEVYGTNHWYGTAVSHPTHVCAGEDKMERGRGAIVVEVWYSADQEAAYGGYFLTPSSQGAVRIQDVIGDQVILVSTNNTVFYFDLATSQWSSPTPGPSPSPSVPTSTNTPTITPTFTKTRTPTNTSTNTSANTSTNTPTFTPTNTGAIYAPRENATVAWQELKAGYPPGWFMDPTIAAEVTQIAMQRTHFASPIPSISHSQSNSHNLSCCTPAKAYSHLQRILFLKGGSLWR